MNDPVTAPAVINGTAKNGCAEASPLTTTSTEAPLSVPPIINSVVTSKQVNGTVVQPSPISTEILAAKPVQETNGAAKPEPPSDPTPTTTNSLPTSVTPPPASNSAPVTSEPVRATLPKPPVAAKVPRARQLNKTSTDSKESSSSKETRRSTRQTPVIPSSPKGAKNVEPKKTITKPKPSPVNNLTVAQKKTTGSLSPLNQFATANFANANSVKATKSAPLSNSSSTSSASIPPPPIPGTSASPTKPKRRKRKSPVSKLKDGNDSDGEPRTGKRVRLQYQPFQSPDVINMMPTMFRTSTFFPPRHPASVDDKIVVFNKGDFLAVRNEFGTFYVCRTAQNVYKSSKRFKIQWLTDEKQPGVYSPDFYDQTDFECVLTNLRMNRVSKGHYKLPDEERQRTTNILERALNVERGVGDIPDPRSEQVAVDGVDVSFVGRAEEQELVKVAETLPRAKSSASKTTGRPKKEKSTKTAETPKREVLKPKREITSKPETSKHKKVIDKSARVKSSPKTLARESKLKSRESREPRKVEVVSPAKSKKESAAGKLLKVAKTGPRMKTTPTKPLGRPKKSKLSESEETPKRETSKIKKRKAEETPPKEGAKEKVVKPIKVVPPKVTKKKVVSPIVLKKSKKKVDKKSSPSARRSTRLSSPASSVKKPKKLKKKPPVAIAPVPVVESVAELLVDPTIDVNAFHKGRTPLLWAAHESNWTLFHQFLSRGADVKAICETTGNTAMHFIVQTPHKNESLAAVETLVKAGLDVNAQNFSKRTALHLCVNARKGENGESYDIEDYLLKNGAALHVKDKRGRIPLHYAFEKIAKHMDNMFIDPIELAVLLTSGTKDKTSIEVADEFGQTPLHRAAFRGATMSCVHLIDLSNNLDDPDRNGNTAFGLSVLNGHESCALMLLQKGASFSLDLNSLALNDVSNAQKFWEWEHIKDELRISKELELLTAKTTILEHVIKRDWEGILYLMLDKLGNTVEGLAIVIEATLRTRRLKLAHKLISRILVNATNLSDHTFIHTLCKNAVVDESDWQKNILQLLVKKGVDVNYLDKDKSSAIIYAAISWNHILCDELTTLAGPENVAKLGEDAFHRTPFSAVFWNLEKEDLSKEIKAWAGSLLGAGAACNVLCQYPIQESGYPGVRFTKSNTKARKYSPLILAVIKGNYAVVKFLLQLKADVNFADSLGRTPLMHAVRLNDLKMVKLLLSSRYDPETDTNPWNSRFLTFQQTSAADLSIKDANGSTLVHHLVAPMEEHTYTSSDVIIRLLAQVGAKLDATDNKGRTPLQIAINRGVRTLSDTLQELLAVEEAKREKVQLLPLPAAEDDVKWEGNLFDYKLDSKQLCEALQAKAGQDVIEVLPLKPDSSNSFGENGEIVLDAEQNTAYDVLLTMVDMKHGVNGLYNFCKLQVVRHATKDLFVVFRRWGRVGDVGQHQETPFTSLDEAAKEFAKLFKQKTGNAWENVKKFKVVPKKFRLVNVERKRNVIAKGFKREIEEAAKKETSKLSTGLYEVIKKLMDVHDVRLEPLDENHSEVDPLTAVSLLSKDTYTKAEEVLRQIEKLIHEKDELVQKSKNYSRDDCSKILDSIVALSEEFYSLVPTEGFSYERLRPIFTIEELRAKMELVHTLQHSGLANQLLLGAQLRKDEVNPVDYVYRSLRCRLQLLNESSRESQLILEYIHNTCFNVKCNVEQIYRVAREGEVEEILKNGFNNHWLLWHGTNPQNLLSILAGGLQISPLGVEISGSRFGKGIYFGDVFFKSRDYCGGKGNTRYMLLCEVALGNMQEAQYKNNKLEEMSETFHSLKTPGAQWRPDPSQAVFWNGRTVPLGSLTAADQGETQKAPTNFSEYVVFKHSQVCLRYLIQFRN